MNTSASRSSKYDKRSAPGTSVPPGHEWSEHISSHGKVYYYNCLTEVSQWDKPRDFDLRRTSSKDSSYSSRSSKYFFKLIITETKLKETFEQVVNIGTLFN